MFAIAVDYTEVFDLAKRFGATVDQIPFSLSTALNTATEKTRSYLIRNTWPGAPGLKVRNQSFMTAALTTKDARASKTYLTTEIFDKLRRGNLMLHAQGGTRAPRGGGHLAIPSRNITRTARGVPSGSRLSAIKGKDFRRGDLIFVRGARGKPKLMYILKTRTPVPKRVPFFEDYHKVMRAELLKALPIAVERAMATRRK